MKATEGDFAINNQVDKYNNQQIAGGFSTEELLNSYSFSASPIILKSSETLKATTTGSDVHIIVSILEMT